MEMEVRDDGEVGPLRLGYYKHQTASPTANMTRATRTSPAPTYDAQSIVCALVRDKMRMRIPSILTTIGCVQYVLQTCHL